MAFALPWSSFLTYSFSSNTCIINQQTDHVKEVLVLDSRMGHYEGHFLALTLRTCRGH